MLMELSKETIAFSQLGVVALKDVFKHLFVHTVLNWKHALGV